jgi:hypothetical protein
MPSCKPRQSSGAVACLDTPASHRLMSNASQGGRDAHTRGRRCRCEMLVLLSCTRTLPLTITSHVCIAWRHYSGSAVQVGRGEQRCCGCMCRAGSAQGARGKTRCQNATYPGQVPGLDGCTCQSTASNRMQPLHHPLLSTYQTHTIRTRQKRRIRG